MGFEPRNSAYLSNSIIKPFVGDRIFVFMPLEQSGQCLSKTSMKIVNCKMENSNEEEKFLKVFQFTI
jgi:hypothetical protein